MSPRDFHSPCGMRPLTRRSSRRRPTASWQLTIRSHRRQSEWLEILDSENKFLAEASPRTAIGFDSSAKFTAPADGVYRVRISDARGLGGPAFVYRLTLTTDPIAESVFPLGGKRGSKIDVALAGQTVPVTIPMDAPAAWSLPFGIQSIPFDIDDLPEFTDSSKPVVAPAILNDRIEKNGAATWKVQFPTSKKYEIELRAKKLGSPLCKNGFVRLCAFKRRLPGGGPVLTAVDISEIAEHSPAVAGGIFAPACHCQVAPSAVSTAGTRYYDMVLTV